ncbi:unnamed protein product [Effrenium voratum]|nr:unnamed protein product [Effrenium voratum]
MASALVARRLRQASAARLIRRFGGFGSEEPRIFREKVRARTSEGVELPEGWTEYRSPARGVYYGHVTGVTQFDLPRGAPSQEQVDRAEAERGQRYQHRSTELFPGAEVRLVGLQLPHLEGKIGTCTQFDPDGYVRVRLSSGELKAVKPQNLMLASQPKADTAPKTPPKPGKEKTKEPSYWPKWAMFALTAASAFVLFRYFQLQEHDKSVEEKRLLKEKEEEEAAGAPLPAGWREHKDPSTGCMYYWKEADPANTTTWQRPK